MSSNQPTCNCAPTINCGSSATSKSDLTCEQTMEEEVRIKLERGQMFFTLSMVLTAFLGLLLILAIFKIGIPFFKKCFSSPSNSRKKKFIDERKLSTGSYV
ncbi:Oidioi.mRNA.OKI2018_I69.PAR.g10998.t1.cds [Oikopleura dioica]|uniref:Oidioi.mRNA.OKI2018_I69.PAR.g10998.t1.cds n=1 Tax=Oikopleura dioica TaxID=34765 RepID=A0ABN7RTI7_OIKDI|nr:Oidioi.mRNA.OKI2018_I69.PAR.g10998.t1.cds [Oikopleura dioica]